MYNKLMKSKTNYKSIATASLSPLSLSPPNTIELTTEKKKKKTLNIEIICRFCHRNELYRRRCRSVKDRSTNCDLEATAKWKKNKIKKEQKTTTQIERKTY